MLLLLLLTCFISNISSNENVIVDLAQGKIQGSHVRTFNNKSSFYSFKGIPYAKPLVGVNKFQVSENLIKQSIYIYILLALKLYKLLIFTSQRVQNFRSHGMGFWTQRSIVQSAHTGLSCEGQSLVATIAYT